MALHSIFLLGYDLIKILQPYNYNSIHHALILFAQQLHDFPRPSMNNNLNMPILRTQLTGINFVEFPLFAKIACLMACLFM